MKINKLLDHINPDTFIDDYLSACGLKHKDGLPPVAFGDEFGIFMHDHRDESIALIVDCDHDGLMSAVIIYRTLSKFCPSITPIFHTGKQHGLHDLMDKLVNYDIIISPDGGSEDSADHNELEARGKSVIVIDHHQYRHDGLSHARIYNCVDWPHANHLSGGAVSLQVVNGGSVKPDSAYIDLAATSIISDSMPVNDSYNMWYVLNGLPNVTNPFLQYIIEKCDKRNLNNGKMTAKYVGWTLAPMTNALMRSDDEDGKRAVFYAFAEDEDFAKALSILRKHKHKQDACVGGIMEDVMDTVDDSHKIVIVQTDGSHPEYSGLVAGKLVTAFGKPAFVLREKDSTTLVGSMRSPIDMMTPINKSGLAKIQGHKEAAGCFIKKSYLSRFIKWADQLSLDFKPSIEVAGEIDPGNITLDMVEQIDAHGNIWSKPIVDPMFYTHLRVNSSDIAIFRKTSNTVRINAGNMSFIKFRVDDDTCSSLESGEFIDIDLTFTLGLNEYNGDVSIQGMIKNMEFEIVDEDVQEEDIDDLFQIG